MRRLSAAFWLFVFSALAGSGRAGSLAERVVILANEADADSLAIARHYAEARSVPPENIVALPMSRGETIPWSEFVATVWSPLQAELARRGWIDAIPMELTDEAGRRKYAMSGHRISYLVVCRGVPLRISNDAGLRAASAAGALPGPQFRVNESAVDSELALLAHATYPTIGFVSNPLFRNDRPTSYESGQIVKVSRLDGPSVNDALSLVDRAIEAEQRGLAGRAYLDFGGNHPDGDRWLEDAYRQLTALGFDTDVDRKAGTMPVDARFDAPAIYLGWYAGAVNGPFLLPGFRFPAGAIALHIHSYSAQTLRSPESNWCGPLIARGVTATVGNVFEPYLQLTHRPDLLLRSLARGDTFGDAVCYAIPAFSWQGVAIGDPLYRPFAVSLDEQWSKRDQLPPRLAGYVTIRRMLELERRKHADQAVALARKILPDEPGVALAFAFAQRLLTAGDPAGAANALGFLPLLKTYRSDEWALVRNAAALLTAAGRPQRAADVYENLLAEPTLPRELRLDCLREARQAAIAGQDMARAIAWQKALDQAAVSLAEGKK